MKFYLRYQTFICAALLFGGAFVTGAAYASSKEILIITGTGSSIGTMQLMAEGLYNRDKYKGSLQKFIEFVFSSDGQKILSDHGHVTVRRTTGK